MSREFSVIFFLINRRAAVITRAARMHYDGFWRDKSTRWIHESFQRILRRSFMSILRRTRRFPFVDAHDSRDEWTWVVSFSRQRILIHSNPFGAYIWAFSRVRKLTMRILMHFNDYTLWNYLSETSLKEFVCPEKIDQ